MWIRRTLDKAKVGMPTTERQQHQTPISAGTRYAAKTDLRIFFSYCCQRYGESTTHRHGESATLQLTNAGSQRLSDSPTHRYGEFTLKNSIADTGVDFRLRMSPQIGSQNRNGSKDSLRDLCRTDSCKKNLKKACSLQCPFKGLK